MVRGAIWNSKLQTILKSQNKGSTSSKILPKPHSSKTPDFYYFPYYHTRPAYALLCLFGADCRLLSGGSEKGAAKSRYGIEDSAF